MDNQALLFSKDHIWAAVDPVQNTARLGLSDYAEKQLGTVMFINLPEVGEDVVCHERFGDIESLKTVSDLISPVSGNVTAVNEELMDSPDQINQSPFDCWMIEVKLAEVPENLMEEVAYHAYAATL